MSATAYEFLLTCFWKFLKSRRFGYWYSEFILGGSEE